MTCPICRKPTNKQYRPFCSKRCADIDLGKWLNGGYAIQSDDPEDLENPSQPDDPQLQRLH